MTDINDWSKLSDEDKKFVLLFVSSNSVVVIEMMRNRYPSLYIGRKPEEAARGWIMIAGLSEVKNFILSYHK